jgi:hypothetical protein
MRKGFVITVSALMLLMVIILLSQSNQRRLREAEKSVIDAQAIDSAAYLFDDVASDLSNMLGPEIGISRNNSESNITFRELLPRSALGSLLSNYSSFIENYSQRINSEISLNFSEVLGGTLLVFSNGLSYNRNSTSAQLRSSRGDTNASAYELSISSNAYRESENISSLSQSGKVKLVIHYSDLNGSIERKGAFDPGSQNIYSVTYKGNPQSALVIRAGNLSNSAGSIGVEQSGSVEVGLNLTARGSWNGSLAYAYDVNMSYRQVNVAKQGLVWVEG